ncbi:MAG: glycosyltransferase [Clostridia bacterium]|nr:glycosyltransferase [Clostridia bacterium]
MSSEPTISVIIPVYKCESCINTCVDSILNQSFTDFEIILVDDGSPDNSGKLCDELAEKYNKITVIHQENQGQAAARNNGVKFARGNWLHFVDCDDSLHPQMLESLYNAVNKNQVKLAMCSAIQGETIPDDFYRNKDINFNTLQMTEDNFLKLCKNERYYYWVVWGKLVHKSIYEKYPLTEGRIYEDNAIVCKWLHEAKKVAVTDTPLYFYYINISGTTKKGFNKKQLDVLWAFKEQIEFFSALGYEKMTEHIATYYFEISANMYHRAKTENCKELIPFIKSKEKEIKSLYAPYIKLNVKQKLYYYERTSKPMFYITRLKNKLGLLK